MEKYAFERLEQQPTAEVLAATVLHASPEKRIKLTALAKEFVFSNSRPDSVTLTSLYKVSMKSWLVLYMLKKNDEPQIWLCLIESV